MPQICRSQMKQIANTLVANIQMVFYKQQMNSEQSHTQFESDENTCRLHITLGEQSRRRQAEIRKIIRHEDISVYEGDVFQSFKNRGKHKEILFDYNADKYCLTVHINKSFYLNVLRMDEYEMLIIARHIITMIEDFLVHTESFVRLMPKAQDMKCHFYSIDAISITIYKDFVAFDLLDNKVIKKIFLRESYFEFKRNLSYRTRESGQLYSYIVQTLPEDQPSTNRFEVKDQDFYMSPRANYVDDLHSNQSLLRRFSLRFLSYYEAFSLSYGLVPLQNHHIRQFYRRCFNSCTFYGMRLKKFGFTFPIRKMPSAWSKDPDREKSIKAWIYFYQDQDKTTFAHEQHNSDTVVKNFYVLDIGLPGISQKNIQEHFLKRLRKALDDNDKRESSDIVTRNSSSSKISVKPRNENSYCLILNEFSFFLDFSFFKLIECKDRKKRESNGGNLNETLLAFSSDDSSWILRFPPSEQFSPKVSKYEHYYQVGIRYKYNSEVITNETLKYSRDPYSYESEIVEIKMFRRKKTATDSDSQEPHHDFLEKDGVHHMKGLRIYINSMLHCWNARDCYQKITNFVCKYTDIVSDKIKEKTGFKTSGIWYKVLPSLSHLLHTLTESFNTPTNTCLLTILKGQEENKDWNEMASLKGEISETECIMLMTISLYELTQAGWTETLPGCVYFFKVFRSEICVQMQMSKKKLIIPDDKNRNTTEKLLKSYMRETFKDHKIKAVIPPQVVR